jgi:hypothetical protein
LDAIEDFPQDFEQKGVANSIVSTLGARASLSLLLNLI